MFRFGTMSLLLAAAVLTACQSTGSQAPAANPTDVRARQQQMEQRYGLEREVLEIERRQRQQRQGLGP